MLKSKNERRKRKKKREERKKRAERNKKEQITVKERHHQLSHLKEENSREKSKNNLKNIFTKNIKKEK